MSVIDPKSLIAALAMSLALGLGSASGEEPPVLVPDVCPDGEEVMAAQTPQDRALQQRVEGRLATAQLDPMTSVDVAVVGSTVCLRGRAANTTDFERAEQVVAQVSGVGQVENRLRIPLAE